MISTESTPATLNLGQAARRLGSNKNDKPVHPATVMRWIKEGAKLSSGARLRLRAVRYPAGWRVAPEWIDEFISTLTSDRLGGTSTPAPTMPSMGHKQAEAFLTASGF